MGNSIVSAGQSQSEVDGGDKAPRDSKISSSDPLSSIGQSISDGVGRSLNALGDEIITNTTRDAQYQIKLNEAIAKINGAIDLDIAQSVSNGVEGIAQDAQSKFKYTAPKVGDIDLLANSAAGVALATNAVNQSNQNRQREATLRQGLDTRLNSLGSDVPAAFDAGFRKGEIDYLVGKGNRASTGLDLSVRTQAQDDFVSFQQGIREAARSNHDAFGDSVMRGTQVVIDNFSPDKGGFTLTFEPEGDFDKYGLGVTGVPAGSFLSFDFQNGKFNTGDFKAIQFGPDFNPNLLSGKPGVAGGVTFALIADGGNFDKSLNDSFTSTEVTIPIKKVPVSFEHIKTGNGFDGFAFGTNNGGVSFQRQVGAGTVDELSIVTRNLNELPAFAFHNLTGGIFSLD